jgi:hypothetical protein
MNCLYFKIAKVLEVVQFIIQKRMRKTSKIHLRIEKKKGNLMNGRRMANRPLKFNEQVF